MLAHLASIPSDAELHSAALSRDYLAAVMDQYHENYIVYEDVSSGGNHFHAWAELRKTIVVDNADSGLTLTGAWDESDATDEFLQSSLESSEPGATARFTPSIPEDGRYQVWAWWSGQDATNTRETSAHYLINGNEQLEVIVDQTADSGGWVLLGEVDFAAGSIGFVELSHETQDGGALSADAVRFVSTAVNTKVTGSSTDNPRRGATEIRAELLQRTASNSGGFYHQVGILPPGETSPQENFGSMPGIGVDLSGVSKLTFWARGEEGGEQIEFFVGGVGYDPLTGQQIEPFPGSSQRIPAAGSAQSVTTLSTDWQQYTIDLSDADLSYLLGGFGWFGKIANNPSGAVFYLDDIQYEYDPGSQAQLDRLDQPRFLRSYSTLDEQPVLCSHSNTQPCVDFDFVLRNVAFSYDNALALLAFLADRDSVTEADSLRRARLIGDAFVHAANNDRTYTDGRIRTAYSAGDISLPPGWRPNDRENTAPVSGVFDEHEENGVITRQFIEIEQEAVDVGNNSWALISLLALHQRTGDVKYLDAAKRIGEFIQTFRDDEGTFQGYFGRIRNPETNPERFNFSSTEHNLDIHAGFATLFELTGDAQWRAGSDRARQFVEDMWDDQQNVFLAGTRDEDPDLRNDTPGQLPLDTHSWSILSIPDILHDYPEALGNAINNHGTTSDSYTGFDFNEDQDGVWFEGTAQMVVALKAAGDAAVAETYLQELRRAQSDPALNPDIDSPFSRTGGIPAAAHDRTSTGFGFELFRRDHIAVAAWNIFAQLGFNPFYGKPINEIATLTPVPTDAGQTFVIDDFDNKVTLNDRGHNYFGGNSGSLNNPTPATRAEEFTTLTVSPDSFGSTGGSLQLDIDFTVQTASEASAGFFTSLLGLTDTKITLQPGQSEPQDPTPFPDYFLDFDNLFGDFLPLQGRTIEQIAFDTRLATGSPSLTVKVELKDEDENDVFTRISVDSDTWMSIPLARDDFDQSVSGLPFNWNRVSNFAIVVERQNTADNIINPDLSSFLIDNIRLNDTDGQYLNLAEFQNESNQTLLPQYETAFLDHVRGTSALYFLDFASTDSRTGGMIQDRSSFADLITVGGTGFQLTSYVIDSERLYLERADAAARVSDILKVLNNEDGEHPMGPAASGTIGHEGFFYHFLGIDGLRKQNFDFTDTAINESLNTVELSTIDTALLVAGVVTAGQYFDGDDPVEEGIRRMANEIYGRVNWKFLLDEQSDQFYLGWKPNENRDDDSGRFGRFKLDDHPVSPQGQYSSKNDNGTEVPATIDFYTDEGLLIALLAMGSPNPDHRVGREVWDAMIRDDQGGSFIRTFPGALFTYQFFSAWVDTQSLGTDSHPSKPVDFFDNTRQAIQATIDYATSNPNDHATLAASRWGLTAAEGPFDSYFAEAAPDAAIHPGGQPPLGEARGSGPEIVLEGESGSGDGTPQSRGNASGEQSILLADGESRSFTFDLDGTAEYDVMVRYSNDSDGPLETIEVIIDGNSVGSFEAQDTGDFGEGWDNFFSSGVLSSQILVTGSHEVTVTVSGGDGFGVEVDLVRLRPKPVPRPLEVGTLTNYGIGSSIVHHPQQAIDALWHSAQQIDLNQDGHPELLHPRFGFADAFNVDISDAVIEGAVDCAATETLRCTGAWAHFNGFSIDHGPMMIMIDNYLHDQFVPSLFMSETGVRRALTELFPTGDYGDAPASYPTLLANDGAVHRSVGPTLGAERDDEQDGQPTGDADGDLDDEDGVRLVTSLVGTAAADTTASLIVTASAASKLDAWIDFNGNGNWLDAGDRLFASSVDLVAGPNLVSFTVPAGTSVGETFGRFRLSSAGGLLPTGLADDGEVEDYRLTVLDGDTGADVMIDLTVGAVEATADGDKVVVKKGDIEIFRAPGTVLSKWHFAGTDSDDLIRLANLDGAIATPIPLVFDGANGHDTIRLIGDNQVLDLTDTVNQLMNIEQIDIVGASPNELTIDGQSVVDATDSRNKLIVIHDEDDKVNYDGGGWMVEPPIFVDADQHDPRGHQHHVLANGSVSVETANTLAYQNPLAKTDVNRSGDTSALDALLIINFLGRFDATPVDLQNPRSLEELAEHYFDVNGSDTASSLDALQVINFLAQELLAEGESTLVSSPPGFSPPPVIAAKPESLHDKRESRLVAPSISVANDGITNHPAKAKFLDIAIPDSAAAIRIPDGVYRNDDAADVFQWDLALVELLAMW